MTPTPPPDLNDDDALAAEYALRLLTGDELARAEQRMADDPAFALAVTGWQARLSAMADEIAPVTPPTSAKSALMAQLFGQAPTTGFWQRLGVWQALTAACVAALIALGVATLTAPAPDARNPAGGLRAGPIYSAQIVSDAGDFRVVAVVDKTTDEIILTKTAGAAPQGRILQVWSHGPDAPALSVGLWPEGDSIRLPMPATIAAVEGVLTIGVSEEPPGGSPTGSPSGRVFGTVDIPGVTGTF